MQASRCLHVFRAVCVDSGVTGGVKHKAQGLEPALVKTPIRPTG